MPAILPHNDAMNQRIATDDRGRLALWQRPNLALTGWFVLTVAHHFIESQKLAWAATVFLVIWAVMEVYSGVNWFRRLLGLAVLVATIWSQFR